MTTFNTQLSYNLAIAIGWTTENIKIINESHLDTHSDSHSDSHSDTCLVRYLNNADNNPSEQWYPFNYNDPTVIIPIAIKYGCFPKPNIRGMHPSNNPTLDSQLPTIPSWECNIWSPIHKKWLVVESPNPLETIAITIIKRNT